MEYDDNRDGLFCLKQSKKIANKKKHKHQCVKCGKHMSDRRNLVRHLRKMHWIEPVIRKAQLKCSYNDDCTFLCATTELLRDHLKKVHDFQVEKRTLTFKSRPEFEKWKQNEELTTNARYVLYTGSKCRGSKKIHYFRCHRSGAIRPESEITERKRSKPSKGYTQCGVTCPSSLRIAEAPNGSIQVIYYPVHLGHSLDDESIPYMKLSLKEKEEIAGKLAQGEPVGKIVSDARKKKGAKFTRMNLLQRRDVYNIKLNLNYLEKEEDHDGKMIDLWVKTILLGSSQDNPIVLYNALNDSKDYTLILIHHIQKIIFSLVFDGSIVYVKTKKGKPNVDFNLTTVSVICENGDAYPIAFCISNKTEYITLYTFFKIIYQNFGEIKSQIFVSDNLSQYYLAWKNVMVKCDNKLICTFEIENFWEEKLTTLKCPINKQKIASGYLKTLLNQTDKDVFEMELMKVLKIWDEDEDMKLFMNFFKKFVKKKFEWATCYRIHSTRKESINKYLEPINTFLDSTYIESYNNLQNSLNLLFGFVRDLCLHKLIKWDEHLFLYKLRETKKKHLEGLQMKEIMRYNELEWVIRDNDCEYIVKKNDSKCDKKCGVFCEDCDICTHNYNCVCGDYVTGFNICKHLHVVGILTGKCDTCDIKNLPTVTLKHSAISMAKSFTKLLEDSNLSEEDYNIIIATVSNLKDKIMKENS